MMEKTLEQQIADKKTEIGELQAKLDAEREKNNPLAIKTLTGIYEKLGVNIDKDKFIFDGFTEDDNKVIEGIVARMRICKVFNNWQLPAKDRRYYPWFRINSKASSGLVFNHSNSHVGRAYLNSAPRLCFLTDEGACAYAENFKEVEEGIIQL